MFVVLGKKVERSVSLETPFLCSKALSNRNLLAAWAMGWQVPVVGPKNVCEDSLEMLIPVQQITLTCKHSHVCVQSTTEMSRQIDAAAILAVLSLL